ncbi:General transcription factor II-I repeat domain-containing protein 2A-like 3, partial [Homarus americanus]
LDESTDICDVAQLSIFIRGIDGHFSVFEELVSLESLHRKTRGSDIFDKVKSCLENLQLDSSKLITVCTDGAPSMIGKVVGTTTLLENFLNRPLLKYHCSIHQESLCGKTLNLQHVMLPVSHLKVVFVILLKKKTALLAFINPFSLSEQKIMKMPSDIQRELIDLKTNSLLKMKFDELSSVPNASNMINFWRSLPCENFPELRKFARVIYVVSERHIDVNKHFHP